MYFKYITNTSITAAKWTRFYSRPTNETDTELHKLYKNRTMRTWVAGTYFDNFAVSELSAMSLALNSHKVISPSTGGGGKTDKEDMF